MRFTGSSASALLGFDVGGAFDAVDRDVDGRELDAADVSEIRVMPEPLWQPATTTAHAMSANAPVLVRVIRR
jgi:hypothetical protein